MDLYSTFLLLVSGALAVSGDVQGLPDIHKRQANFEVCNEVTAREVCVSGSFEDCISGLSMQ